MPASALVETTGGAGAALPSAGGADGAGGAAEPAADPDGWLVARACVAGSAGLASWRHTRNPPPSTTAATSNTRFPEARINGSRQWHARRGGAAGSASLPVADAVDRPRVIVAD